MNQLPNLAVCGAACSALARRLRLVGQARRRRAGGRCQTATPQAAPAAGAGGSRAGTAQSAVTTVDATKIDPTAAGNLGRVVYFDYDSYV